MVHLKIQHSIQLKHKTNQTILNLSKFQKSLTKFPSWILLIYKYKNQAHKNQIIYLENPLKNLKKQILNNQPFFKGLATEFNQNECKTIEILICKN